MRHEGRLKSWLVTVAAAAVLLGVGYQMGSQSREHELSQVQAQAAVEAGRANRLAAENRALEKRFLELKRLHAAKNAPGRPLPPTSGDSVVSGVLHKSRAVIALDGKLVLTLEEVGGSPRRAVIKVKVIGGRQGRAVLGPGSSVGVKVGNSAYDLVIKALHTSSASYSLIKRNR